MRVENDSHGNGAWLMHETVVEHKQRPTSPEASWGGGDVPVTPQNIPFTAGNR